MTRRTINTLGSTTLNHADREDMDFYQTPDFATKTLLHHLLFPETIWEPMAGNGAISKILVKNGFNVISTDIVERKFKLNATLDYFDSETFLTQLPDAFSIITNPPYEFANEFLKYTLTKIRPLQCCVFLPVRYLEGQQRYNEIYSQFRPSKVLMYVKRLGCYKQADVEAGVVTERGVGSAVAYMWLCFDRDQWLDPNTKTMLEWIN